MGRRDSTKVGGVISYGSILKAWLNQSASQHSKARSSVTRLRMATPYPPGPSSPAPVTAEPCSRVELSVSCSDLLDKDIFSKSDPIAVLSIRPQGQASYTEVGAV